MTQIDPKYPIQEIHGKLRWEDDVYFRMRNGKIQTVHFKHPRTSFSEREKAVRKSFGSRAHQASLIFHDPQLSAAYLDGFNAQKDLTDAEGNFIGQRSFYHYILSHLPQESVES